MKISQHIHPALVQTSAILWEGPSELDGQPIVLIAVAKTRNGKTGTMVQTYIIRRDVSPIDAVNNGDDKSICGDCVHRGPMGDRSCYVRIEQGVNQTWKAYQRGRYAHVDPTGRRLFENAKVRMGTYGDPMAVPFRVWSEVLDGATGWTGYTHQWQQFPESPLKAYCMASADSAADRHLARAMGWRCYVVLTGDESKPKGAATCPASEEAGKKLQCADCLACDGASGKRGDIAIRLHGSASILKAAERRFA